MVSRHPMHAGLQPPPPVFLRCPALILLLVLNMSPAPGTGSWSS